MFLYVLVFLKMLNDIAYLILDLLELNDVSGLIVAGVAPITVSQIDLARSMWKGGCMVCGCRRFCHCDSCKMMGCRFGSAKVRTCEVYCYLTLNLTHFCRKCRLLYSDVEMKLMNMQLLIVQTHNHIEYLHNLLRDVEYEAIVYDRIAEETKIYNKLQRKYYRTQNEHRFNLRAHGWIDLSSYMAYEDLRLIRITCIRLFKIRCTVGCYRTCIFHQKSRYAALW